MELVKIKDALRKKITGSIRLDPSKIDIVSEPIPQDDILKVTEPDPSSPGLATFQTSFKKRSKKRRGVLRFDLDAVGVADLASQYYCEKQ
ncbi:MAG: hypothetical protein IH932_04830, partial [Thaumarchaeota archaeon]|nr:hypothetical protein [Nitrososphaerota archaeon]